MGSKNPIATVICFFSIMAGLVLAGMGINVPLGVAMIIVPVAVLLAFPALKWWMKRKAQGSAAVQPQQPQQPGSIKSAFEDAGTHLLLAAAMQESC